MAQRGGIADHKPAFVEHHKVVRRFAVRQPFGESGADRAIGDERSVENDEGVVSGQTQRIGAVRKFIAEAAEREGDGGGTRFACSCCHACG
jgi:hypothetical protein